MRLRGRKVPAPPDHPVKMVEEEDGRENSQCARNLESRPVLLSDPDQSGRKCRQIKSPKAPCMRTGQKSGRGSLVFRSPDESREKADADLVKMAQEKGLDPAGQYQVDEQVPGNAGICQEEGCSCRKRCEESRDPCGPPCPQDRMRG